MNNYDPLNAEVIASESLIVPRARALMVALESKELPYVKAISLVRMKDASEGVILEIEIEVGQEPPIPINRCERVSILFNAADDSCPEVQVLRDDFPHVPHLNGRPKGALKSLCLYEDDWTEVKLRWTPSGFVERIRTWFALTAEGKLHGDDQPLEPILFGGSWRLVLPSDMFDAPVSGAPQPLLMALATNEVTTNVIIAQRPHGQQVSRTAFVATSFQTGPQQHGVIQHTPHTLADLCVLVGACGLDLLAELRNRLSAWEKTSELRQATLILVAHFPKTRTADGVVETRDVWSFSTEFPIEELGKRLGLWDVVNGHIAAFLSPDLSKQGDDVRIDVLNTSFALSRSLAAALNGVAPNTMKVTAIGAGALGSQVIPKLLQCGFGVWTIIDDDRLLPHNAARHQFASRFLVGQPKATLLGEFADNIFEGSGSAKGLVANVLKPLEKESEVRQSLVTAEAIVDFSASVAVGRYLSRVSEAKARRVSIFLNPRGTDLVVLAEDVRREKPVDFLEMVYYAEVAANSSLRGHLDRGAGRLRYARSCRDLTSSVPEDLVGLHSAIASRAIRCALSSDEATITIWRADANLAVERIAVAIPNAIEVHAGNGWRLIAAESVLQKIRSLRKAKLPNETGGVFVGHFDTEAAVAYIVDTLPAPPDSKEYPVHYIRGSAGLRANIENIKTKTATMLHYLGEWHSHPDGHSCTPSGDDLKVFAWLTRWMQIDGYPGLMLIVGEKEEKWFIGQMG